MTGFIIRSIKQTNLLTVQIDFKYSQFINFHSISREN